VAFVNAPQLLEIYYEQNVYKFIKYCYFVCVQLTRDLLAIAKFLVQQMCEKMWQFIDLRLMRKHKMRNTLNNIDIC